ncbi:MAG: PEP-CTERM-box response regulator transcription factor [Gammaproteobacteria bacterium]
MSEKKVLLVVEDDPVIQEQLKWGLDSFEVEVAGSRKEAVAKVRRFEPSVVTLDLGLPPDAEGSREGFETLRALVELNPRLKIIMLTGQSDRALALKSIGMGAYDFYNKPIELNELKLILDRAFYLSQLENEYLHYQRLSTINRVPGVLTVCENMQKICQLVERVASANVTTLLLGESGTGKEVLSRGIHQLSDRSKKPFIAINCAAIPDNLLESELFGYEKGAFTGASKQTLGKIECAQGGTLLLDEVGDLPLALQPKLLRFLQERVIERIGGRQVIPVDVRVICATHQNLKEKITQQTFREDLYYRISEITINIPPLRERKADILLLANVFLRRFAQELKRPVKGFTTDAKQLIEGYSWPGNIREMENKIKRSVILAESKFVSNDDLELIGNQTHIPFNLKEIRDRAEREAVLRALGYCEGNLSKASELLGITRPTLYNIMERLGLANETTENITD